MKNISTSEDKTKYALITNATSRQGKMDSPEEVAKLAYGALKKKARGIIGPVGKR